MPETTIREHEYILGISAYYHDSAAALLKDGVLIAAAQEERFSRKKHDPDFPHHAVAYVLEEAGITLDKVAKIAFYDKPLLKFERLLETYHAFAPQGFKSFAAAIGVWIKEKVFMRTLLEKALRPFMAAQLSPKASLPPLFFPEHHLSHAASAFYPSPYEEAAILTIDGVGEWTTTSLMHGKGNSLTALREIHFPHSLGLLYSAFTAYCGFKVNSGEYKLMGLAPYGIANSERVARMEELICEHLLDIREDGSYLLHMDYFAYATDFRMYNERKWTELFGFPPRAPEAEDIAQEYMDMALAIQNVTEKVVLRLAATVCALTGSKNLCMAGGVALNCVANGKLLQSGIVDSLWIQPAAGDAGGALGAALAVYHVDGAQRHAAHSHTAHTYWGPAFGQDDIARVSRKYHAEHKVYTADADMYATVADLLAEGKVVGWFQGRMEFGPRALGNRSILGDPRNPDMQKKLNLSIKYREGFRPFAPSILAEEADKYFGLSVESPYMLLVMPVADQHLLPLPENYASLPLWERLYCQRSTLPAITHVDHSARIQTVDKQTNPRYWGLLDAFHQRHGCPVLVNTSFNVRGEPIVCTPEDAYICFMRTEMDALVMGNTLFYKHNQAPLPDNDQWRQQYTLD